ncbi:MAG: chromosomal replication initiator protein DnaA [Firmicutes bacterium]|nr:chromosomal replication initiator protein DnaA [Bacillota bacterium]MDD7601157.1 chromosomal replication initiator protein DnaA [Bacillota bacterium]MDY5857122.1 chromosomal replication initiator protein DnaA [Anaerovoracaceae bacterium]
MNRNEKITKALKEELQKLTTAVSFSTWLQPLEVYQIDQDLKIVYLGVKNSGGVDVDFILNIIRTRYIQVIEDCLETVLHDRYRAVIKVMEDFLKKTETTEAEELKTKEILHAEPAPKIGMEKIFNPRYNFDNFVVGNSNKYAHAAALAVAESPSEAYNPLFIYGGSGLGKTHLMHAIGIFLLEHNPNMNVLYVSSEMFTNELIRALRENKISEFKNKYRKVDVLLIDDIQFMEGKDSTQEEFFHTFNTLYDSNKQIIISSDRAPNKLVNLEERLRSRFQWNLIADIQPPDYETRVAILTKKAENLNIEVDDDLYDVICLIAEKIKDNIRELEGAFTRIVSFSQLLGEKADKNFARRTLKDILTDGDIKVTPEKIKKYICRHYSIKMSDLESSKKQNSIAYPRQVAMYLIREMTDYSLPKIGQMFGGKHYTTVMYACDKIEGEIKSDPAFAQLIEQMKDEIMD